MAGGLRKGSRKPSQPAEEAEGHPSPRPTTRATARVVPRPARPGPKRRDRLPCRRGIGKSDVFPHLATRHPGKLLGEIPRMLLLRWRVSRPPVPPAGRDHGARKLGVHDIPGEVEHDLQECRPKPVVRGVGLAGVGPCPAPRAQKELGKVLGHPDEAPDAVLRDGLAASELGERLPLLLVAVASARDIADLKEGERAAVGWFGKDQVVRLGLVTGRGMALADRPRPEDRAAWRPSPAFR